MSSQEANELNTKRENPFKGDEQSVETIEKKVETSNNSEELKIECSLANIQRVQKNQKKYLFSFFLFFKSSNHILSKKTNYIKNQKQIAQLKKIDMISNQFKKILLSGPKIHQYHQNKFNFFSKINTSTSTISSLSKQKGMEAKKEIYLITGNQNKLKEFQQILAQTHLTLSSTSIDLPELQGKPEDIAKEKAMIAFKEAKKPVIVEDTSLCFNAMNGLPGPYIKWFLDELKPAGLHRMLAGFEDKTGYAQCIITYMSEELKEPICFIGRTEGTIVEPRGPQNFGWDPVFQPDGYELTYAELPKEEKNKISHRFRAIDKMVKHFSA